MPRYLMCCAGLLLLATAIGLSQIPRLRHLSAALAVFVGLGLPAWVRIQAETFNGPFTRLANLLRDAGDSSPVLLHNDCQAFYPSWHAVTNARHILITKKGEFSDASGSGVYDTKHLASTSELSTVLETTQRVWVVDAEPAGFHVDPSRILEHTRWRQQGETISLSLPMSWVKVKLLRFEIRPISSQTPYVQ